LLLHSAPDGIAKKCLHFPSRLDIVTLWIHFSGIRKYVASSAQFIFCYTVRPVAGVIQKGDIIMKKPGIRNRTALKICHLSLAGIWIGGAVTLNLMLPALEPAGSVIISRLR
jgi:hypothetical protein